MRAEVWAREALVLISCSSARDQAPLGGGAGCVFRRTQELVRGVEELGRGCRGVVEGISAVVGRSGGKGSSLLTHLVVEPCFRFFRLAV